jgi:hypothetical protein
MSKALPLSDHRSRRRYLTNDDYAWVGEGLPFVPSGRIARATWKNIMGLPDSVAIETSDGFAPELEWADRLAWSWLDILDQLPKDSPAQYQVFSALETFQASIFNVTNGWYRISGICLRCGLEDMLLGLYYQYRPADREEYELITDGKKPPPSLSRFVYAELNQHGASSELIERITTVYSKKLSVHVHRRSDGTNWSSNGPVYVPDAFRNWLSEFRETYSLLCEVIDVTIPGTAIAQIAESHLKAAPFSAGGSS